MKGELEKVHFVKLPYFSSLTKRIKDKFHQEVNRISCKTKCSDLLHEHDSLLKDLKREAQVASFAVSRFISVHQTKLRNIVYAIVVAINILILLSFERSSAASEEGSKDTTSTFPEGTVKNTINNLIIKILGINVIVFAIAIVGYNIYLRLPVILRAWKGVGDKGLIVDIPTRFFKMLLQIFQVSEKNHGLISKDFMVIYYVVYGLAAFAGTLVHPLFFAFHLFDILLASPLLLNVVQAVWRPKGALFLTIILFLVLMYIFSTFSYLYF